MKREHVYVETSIWFRSTITDPYQTIATAYDHNHVGVFKDVVGGLLTCASSKRVFINYSPADLLHYLKLIESIINAAFILDGEKKESPIHVGDYNLFDRNLFCGKLVYVSDWIYIPKQLEQEEYADPYKAICQFFKFKTLEDWKQQLNIIFEYAFSEHSLFDDCVQTDILPIYSHLAKLLEAAHLIDVREVTHVRGTIKNRMR